MLSDAVQLEQNASFLPELWAWYGVGVCCIALRYLVRIRTVGVRDFQGDDYVMFVYNTQALLMYTADAVLVDLVYHTGANVDINPNTLDQLTNEDVRILTYGSKAELAAWYSYTALIWCIKFTMLFFYKRLTFGTIQSQTVTYLFYLCGASYVAVFLTITFGCHPISGNWQIRPLPSKTCAFKPQNLWVTVVLNVLTDAIILVIPVPMLWKLKAHWTRKLAIGALLSSGVFIIAAALIRAVLTLDARPSTVNINRWGVRETIIGLLSVNIPILRPLFSTSFWRRGPHVQRSSTHSSFGWSKTRSRRRSNGGLAGAYRRTTYELESHIDNSGKDVPSSDTGPTHDNDSQEEIMVVSLERAFREPPFNETSFNVMVSHTYDVQSIHKDEEEKIQGDWTSRRSGTGYQTRVSSGIV